MKIDAHRAVAFKANDRDYLLCYDVNALCVLEERTGRPAPTIFRELADEDKLTISAVRSVLWAGLQRYHADEFTDIAKVGDLVADAGGIGGVVEKISDALIAGAMRPTAPLAAA